MDALSTAFVCSLVPDSGASGSRDGLTRRWAQAGQTPSRGWRTLVTFGGACSAPQGAAIFASIPRVLR